jgi:hypothetical protein
LQNFIPQRPLDCYLERLKNFTELLTDPLGASESFHMLNLGKVKARNDEDVSVI